jgi:hypothetical protein
MSKANSKLDESDDYKVMVDILDPSGAIVDLLKVPAELLLG